MTVTRHTDAPLNFAFLQQARNFEDNMFRIICLCFSTTALCVSRNEVHTRYRDCNIVCIHLGNPLDLIDRFLISTEVAMPGCLKQIDNYETLGCVCSLRCQLTKHNHIQAQEVWVRIICGHEPWKHEHSIEPWESNKSLHHHCTVSSNPKVRQQWGTMHGVNWVLHWIVRFRTVCVLSYITRVVVLSTTSAVSQ